MIADLVSDVFKNDVPAKSCLPHLALAPSSQLKDPLFFKTPQVAASAIVTAADQEQANFEMSHLAPIIDEL